MNAALIIAIQNKDLDTEIIDNILFIEKNIIYYST